MQQDWAKRVGAAVQRINSIGGTAVGDQGLSHLVELGKLSDLRLGRTKVSDRGLETLSKLKTLRTLELSGSKVTAAGVAKLQAALPQCKISGAPKPAEKGAKR